MAGLVPQSFIDDLLSRIDIVDIVDARVKLKKTGRNYSALCPFHKEKSPSFSVNQEKQFYYCFGCGAGGNAVNFLMEHDRLEFIEAIETLAQTVGVEVPRTDTTDKQNRQELDSYALLDKTAQFYRKHLSLTSNAIDYLKKRGLTGEVAKQFLIGYAPHGWDFLLKELGKNEHDVSLLEKNGLLIRKDEGGFYDRFRDRIIFPIRDTRGRVIAFGGRVLGDEKPKYLNSPETPIFQKGKELYGLYEAKQAHRHLARIVIVEGYMDVVALAQHGINYAVATLGTATSSAHIEKLFKSTSKIIFCFDGDAAGRTAAWRALESTLPVIKDGFEAGFLFLPEGEDPDTLVRQEGAELFSKRLQNADALSTFFFAHLSSDINLSTLDGRARLSQAALPLIRKIPKGALHTLMLNRLAELTGLKIDQLQQLAGEKSPPTHSSPNVKPTAEAPVRRTAIRQPNLQSTQVALTPTKTAIIILLHHPELAKHIIPGALQPRSGELDEALLIELVEYLHANPSASTATILGHWYDSPLTTLLAGLAAYQYPLPPQGLEVQLQDCLTRLKHHQTERDLKTLLTELKDNPTPDRKAELQRLLAQKHQGKTPSSSDL